MTDVFLSYVAEDREQGEALSDALESHGLTVFRRDHTIGYGPTLTGHVNQQQLAASCTVALWSSAAVGHAEFLAVALEARSRNRLLSASFAPVMIPPPFDQLPSLNLAGWERDSGHRGFMELESRIRNFISPEPDRELGSPDSARTSHSNTPPIHDRDKRTVFLCYRREDTQHAADRLHERLVQAYGSDRVFMDIDSVPLGVNFVSYIDEQLRRCAAVLVLIGPHWMKLVDDEGNRRLEDSADHVRIEIAAALSHGVPVIPLMVQDASMPRAKDLPDNIRELAYQNGMPMPRAYWRESLDRLIKRLEPLMSRSVRPALADKAPNDSVNPLSAIHKLVERRDNRRLLICYPEDARLWATRIYDRVVAAHGFRAIFRIRDAQGPGPAHDTPDVLATRGAIVLLTPLAIEPHPTRGRDDAFYETVAALLKANVPVIPVLVHGAAFPAPRTQLPEAVRPLASMNAIRLEHTDWAIGAKQLLKALQPLMA